MREIYLDHASTTRMYPEVIRAMTDAFTTYYANASSVHAEGIRCRNILKNVREELLETLSLKESGQIYFTSGGTEGDNWAIKGVAETRGKGHIITTAIEHKAVLEPCRYLQKRGFEVTFLGVDEDGVVSPEELKAAIRPDTILISVQYANNEVGSIQPIREIGAIAHAHHIPFHTDAVQAYGHLPIDVDEEHIDLLSVSAHKFGGPKGVGFLYVRNGTQLESLIHGGSQEEGYRAGTVNVPGIIGMGVAARIACTDLRVRNAALKARRDLLIRRILSEISDTKLNGSPGNRLPNHIHISFAGYSAGLLLEKLDKEGIYVSTGSACASGKGKPSHVLEAMGLGSREIESSLRMTLDESITEEEINIVIEQLKKAAVKKDIGIPVNIFGINF